MTDDSSIVISVKKPCRTASDNSKQLQEIVSGIGFRSAKSNLGTRRAETLENPSSLAMMFCVR